MPKKLARSSRGSVKSETHRIALKQPATKRSSKWVDPDDAPEVTDAMLDRAELREGERLIRRGRPPIGGKPKAAVTLRLDQDVIDSYRGTGSGWQSRINADLRKARKLSKLAS